MKKTLHTLLTATAFASAIGSANAANVNAEVRNVQAESNSSAIQENLTVEEPVTTTTAIMTTTVVPLYGPPWAFTTTTTASDEELELLTTTTTSEPQDVYGPPGVFFTTTAPSPLYGPPAIYPKGDIDMNYRVNAIDLAMMKNGVINGFKPYVGSLSDINGDGESNIADVVAMQNFLIGRSKDYTSNTVVSDIEENLNSTDAPPQPEYGVLVPDWNTVKTTHTSAKEQSEK